MDVGDPAQVISAAFEDDPETNKLRTLLETWSEAFGETPKGVGELVNDFNDANLQSSLREIAGEGAHVNPRRLGRWLERNADRIVNDLALVRAGKRNGSVLWRVRDDSL